MRIFSDFVEFMSDSQKVDQKVSTEESPELQDIEVSASGCPGVEVCEVSSEGSEKDDLSPMETENKCIVFQGAVDTENASPETPVDTENLSPGTHVNPENVSPQTPVDTENLSPETHFDPENVPEKLELDKLASSEDQSRIGTGKPATRESKRNSSNSRKVGLQKNEAGNEVREKFSSRTEAISKRSTRSIASAINSEPSDSPSTPATKTPILGVALSKRARSTAGATPSYQDLHSVGHNEEKEGEEEASPKNSVKDKCYQTKPPTLIAHNKDYYCWICHQSEDLHACNSCFRVYHSECLETDPESALFKIDVKKTNWECFECLAVEKCARTSRCSTWLSIENLGMCLQKVVSRLANTPSFDLFSEAVDKNEYPDYTKFIYKPMNLAKMDKKAMTLQYSCGESLRQDCKLFFHNSSIFNGPVSPITTAAKRMLGVCDRELAQIEACPDCYCNSLLRSDFFVIPCRIPHPLVWAKFGSYPYWPSKVFAVLSSSKKLDCRFFGAHDRANVPFNCAYKYSKDPPEPVTKHLKKFEAAYAEAERYVKKLQTYQNFKLAVNKTKYIPPAQGEAFGEIHDKIAADLMKQNEDSESVSPQIMKQIDARAGSSSKSESKRDKKSKKDENEVVSTDDLSSDSESDSDSEVLLAKLSSGQKSSPVIDTTKTLTSNGSKSEGKRGISSRLTTSNQNSSLRNKRALGMNFASHTDENANMTPIPPSKKPRNETPIPNMSLDRKHKLKLELSNKKDLVVNSPFSEEAGVNKISEEKDVKKEDASNTSYNKTRSRRSTSPSKNLETIKKERKEHSKEKNDQIEEEFIEDDTPTEESSEALENLVASKEIQSDTLKNAAPPQMESSQAETVESERNAGLFNNLSESMDTSPVSEQKPSPVDSTDHTCDVSLKDMESKADQALLSEPPVITDVEKSEVKKDVVIEPEEKLEAVDCTPVQPEVQSVVPPITEKLKAEDKPKKETTLKEIDSKTQSVKIEPIQTQSEPQNLATSSKKPALDAVLSELEETGRGKRTKFKSTLYNSDEEIDPTKFTKSASKKAKEGSWNGSSLAATLQAKRMATQTLTPKVEGNSVLSPSAKSSGPAFQRSVSHGSPAVKPVILSETNKMHSKPKGVVKGTPQPTPPKAAPGPSSEDALVDKVTERLSGSLGELVKQVLEAQSRGDSLSREDILNAIMNRTSLPPPPNKTGSIAPVAPLFTPAADTFSPSTPPIRKKVETRDSPAQVDIPNEIAATQRAELRKLITEKKAALDERQKLIDEIATWQRKVKNIKEAEVERKEALTNKLRQEFSSKVDEFKREKSLQLNDLTRHYELLIAEIETNMSCLHREEMKKLKEQHGNDLKDVKRKQWCAYCLKESQYHCCWNTSYCDYRCQQKHWSEHMKTCTQKSRSSAKKAASSSQSSSSENSKGRPSPMPSPSASPASTTSSTLPMTIFTSSSGVTGVSNGTAVSGSNVISVGMAATPGGPHIQAGGIPANPQLQPGGIAPTSIPGGAHIVTLPPGTLPPPGSVPMMFNPNVQQPPTVLPFNPTMMQMGPPPVSVMPGTSMGAP